MTARALRPAAGLLLLGAILLIGWWLFAASPSGAMHGYLAAWLVAAALPLGALPCVLLFDLVGIPIGTSGLAIELRRMLWLMPLAGLLLIPVLAAHGSEFPHATLPSEFGRWWLAPAPMIVRSVGYFVIWSVFALAFATPPRVADGRRGLALAGLALHLPLITLAAVDWAMATEAGWSSGLFGLLFLSSQMVFALAAAVLLAGGPWRRAAGSAAATLLLIASAVWLFLQFMQFLVMWSADRPDQVIWYIHRDADAGRTIEWIGFIGGFVLPGALLAALGWHRRPGVTAGVAALLLIVHGLEMFWLVTPSYRHHFGLGGTEICGSFGLVAVLLACAPLRDALRPRQAAVDA